jgi:quinol monooxygenase YgiN
MALDRQIINVNEYALQAPPEEFVAAIGALAARTEAEGHPGVLSYRFFVNAGEGTAGAVIVYEDAAAWMEHHRLAYQWEEMPQLQATVALERLAMFGPLNDEMREWVDNAGFSFIHYDELAAGFSR